MKQVIRKSSKVLFAIFVFCSLLLELSLPGTSAYAFKRSETPAPTIQSNTLISVNFSKGQVNPGDTFDVTVNISTDVETKGAQFQLEFDPNKVEVSGAEAGTFYSDFAKAYGNGAQGMTLPSLAVDNKKGVLPATAFFMVGVDEPKGPSGSGVLAILHAKAKDGASGTVNFSLSTIEVDDTGPGGKAQPLSGVKFQDAILLIGNGAPVQQPTAGIYIRPTPKVVSTGGSLDEQPTIARRVPSSSGSSGSIPWAIILPVAAGVLIVGAVVVVVGRKKGK
jgi:hypothetical protein